jgi:hypothetical protein
MFMLRDRGTNLSVHIPQTSKINNTYNKQIEMIKNINFILLSLVKYI